MQIGIFNAQTGKQIVRDATPEEVEAREAEITEYLADKEAQKLAAAQAASAKSALLERLGITVEEAKLLLS